MQLLFRKRIRRGLLPLRTSRLLIWWLFSGTSVRFHVSMGLCAAGRHLVCCWLPRALAKRFNWLLLKEHSVYKAELQLWGWHSQHVLHVSFRTNSDSYHDDCNGCLLSRAGNAWLHCLKVLNRYGVGWFDLIKSNLDMSYCQVSYNTGMFCVLLPVKLRQWCACCSGCQRRESWWWNLQLLRYITLCCKMHNFLEIFQMMRD